MNNTINFLVIIVFAAIVIPAGSLRAQPKGHSARFEHLSLEQGISHNLTHDIHQDRLGFLWFGTVFGLIKYDGYTYTTYRNRGEDAQSISHDDISCILEDRDGYLWIGTRGGGLNRFDRDSETFTRYEHNPRDTSSLSHNFVLSLCQDHHGDIWVGTRAGLNRLPYLSIEKRHASAFRRYNIDMRDITSLSNDVVSAVFEDRYDQLWIGTNNGLNKFNPETDTFTRYFHFDPNFTHAYHPDLYNFVNRLVKSRPALCAITRVGDFQDIAKNFTIRKTQSVLVIDLGEGRAEFMGQAIERMTDHGWIENGLGTKTMWDIDFNKSLYAGGAQKNRIKIEILTLTPGEYRLRYRSDDSHCYNKWNNHPPEHPEYWGIQVLTISNNELHLLRNKLSKIVNYHPNSISDNAVTSISDCDEKNALWVGTANGGLNKFFTDNELFLPYEHEPGNPNSLISNHIYTIFRDSGCTLWIGTDKGVSRYNAQTETFINYHHDPLNPHSLSSNFVYTIEKDRSGIMWFGTYWGGIDKLDNKKSRFTHIRKNQSNATNLAENNIFAIHSQNSDSLWLGSGGYGLLLYDRRHETFTRFAHDPDNPNSLSNNFVRAIVRDHDNTLWIGTYGGGLNHFNPETGSFQHYTYDNLDPASLSDNSILSLLIDKQNRLWIGTDGGGLNWFDKENESFVRLTHSADDPFSISSDQVYALFEDDMGRLWVGTTDGLNLFDEPQYRFMRFQHTPNDPSSLSNNYVYAIQGLKDAPDHFLWIGTAGGLNRFDIRNNRFEHFNESHGLPSQVIYGILHSNKQDIWLSTNKGLSRFNTVFTRAKNFDLADGLQSNMFNIGAYHKLNSGELIFGGINGINVFHPNHILINRYIPPVYITGFKVFDKEHSFGEDFAGLDKIELSHKDNFFTIEFAALDYTHPQKNHYIYRLIGVDKNGVHLKDGHSASYTNVEPGNYTFEVLGSNNNGVWSNKKARLDIVVQPPFWLTGWFKALVSLMLAASVISIMISVRNKEIRKAALTRKISELKLQALRAQMNPHFIFNTINSIQYFISNNDADSAYFYLSKFAKLMRITLDNSEQSTIPLSDELEMLNLYLELQQLRFENLFTYRIDVERSIDIHNTEIPTMLLQPYVENAIQHGFISLKSKGKIQIQIRQDKDILVCMIEDNGIGIKKSLQLKKIDARDHTPSGMKLTRERLEILNRARRHEINVLVKDLNEENEHYSGTRVEIHVPV